MISKIIMKPSTEISMLKMIIRCEKFIIGDGRNRTPANKLKNLMSKKTRRMRMKNRRRRWNKRRVTIVNLVIHTHSTKRCNSKMWV